MKARNRRTGRLVIAAVTVLAALVLAACSASTPGAESTPAATEPAASTDVQATEPAAETSGLGGDPAGPTAPTPTPIVVTLEGAETTDSGLQYLEETAGKGDTPKKGDLVTMHYSASLPDGTELVSTFTQGEPITTVWGANQLLPGWEEGVGLMNAGTKAKMVLPPALAFGEAGSGSIPPNTQIVLEVELLTVEAAPVPAEVAEKDLTTAESGLQYYDLEVGDGAEAVKNTTVKNAFTVWFKDEDGTYMFIDSSERSPEVEFVIGRLDYVFPGWDEGVTGMKVGGKRLLVIPPALGLGSQQGSVIPPDSTLVMEVELLDVTEPRLPEEVDEDDYTTTESGLKYYDLVEGTGETPKEGQTVVVHYTGWLEDGTQFDSSVDSGQPFSFPLGQGRVIPGWDEGVSTMKVGTKRQLVIPAELGYGDSGAGIIPPGATLIFEVELLEIQE